MWQIIFDNPGPQKFFVIQRAYMPAIPRLPVVQSPLYAYSPNLRLPAIKFSLIKYHPNALGPSVLTFLESWTQLTLPIDECTPVFPGF